MLKVAGGKYRSRLLEVPEVVTVPTKSIVREALANALRYKIQDSVILDLFAGSGALGIEALSWGAKKAYFVDKSPEAAKIIRKNLLSLKIDNAEVINTDFKDALNKIPCKIDLVFMDPPYKDVNFYQEGVSLLLSSSILNDDAVIVLEYENDIIIDETPFEEVRNYKYGRNKIKILWRKKS